MVDRAVCWLWLGKQVPNLCSATESWQYQQSVGHVPFVLVSFLRICIPDRPPHVWNDICTKLLITALFELAKETMWPKYAKEILGPPDNKRWGSHLKRKRRLDGTRCVSSPLGCCKITKARWRTPWIVHWCLYKKRDREVCTCGLVHVWSGMLSGAYGDLGAISPRERRCFSQEWEGDCFLSL